LSADVVASVVLPRSESERAVTAATWDFFLGIFSVPSTTGNKWSSSDCKGTVAVAFPFTAVTALSVDTVVLMGFVGTNADDLVEGCDKESNADPGWPAVSALAALRGDDDKDDFTEDNDDSEEKDELCAVVSWALLGGRLGRELG
jgi:hypothetical protein